VPPYPEQVPDELPAPPVWSQDISGESNTCSKDSNTYCEQVLIEYNNPLTPAEIEAGLASRKKRSTIRIDWDSDVPDFDLEVYQSDSKGAVGDMIGSSTEQHDVRSRRPHGDNHRDSADRSRGRARHLLVGAGHGVRGNRDVLRLNRTI
jgi:hypothetical protein